VGGEKNRSILKKEGAGFDFKVKKKSKPQREKKNMPDSPGSDPGGCSCKKRAMN